ncbi:MAG: lysophospholipid acyltransferase family protein [Planctomycetes bacterium]|nr:lysophospholipid acyltransferase family protein [Planctomycetota bacterium]
MIRRAIGRLFLWTFGWKVDGDPPPIPKFVMIAAPHTSNWDFPFMIAVSYAMNVRLRWLGKASLFRFPQGLLFRALGGISVDRSKRNNLVQQVAEAFAAHERLIVTVSAEGTRSGGDDYWKSGFYRIALAAGVPVALGYLDFTRKRGGVGPLLYPTGDVKADMEQVRGFYTPSMAKFPERFRTPRLRDEEVVTAADDAGR